MSLSRWHTIENLKLPSLRRSKPPAATFTVTFPPEIWALIIECVLDSLRAHETYCKSGKITQYGTQFENVGGIGSNDDWCTIRLVCHAWTVLAGPRRQMYVRKPHYRLHPRLTGVKFGYGVHDFPFKRLVDAPDISRRLTSLSLLEGHGDVHPGDTIELFLDNSSNFQMLRSLVLRMANESERTPNLWGRLMEGYPLLIHLSIFDCFLPYEDIFFGELQSLIIGTSSCFRSAPGKFTLPSLKSLAILGWKAEFEQLLEDHGHQLTSLTFSSRYPRCLAINDKFWTYIPNLLVLDLNLSRIDMEEVGSIPAGHPLQRICVHALPNDRHQTEKVGQILDKFPEVSHLCLSETVLYSWRRKAICRLANQRGVEFSAFPNRDSLDGLTWYRYLFHRSYRIRRKRDLLFFPFGATVALVVGTTCLLYWGVNFVYRWVVGYVKRLKIRLPVASKSTTN